MKYVALLRGINVGGNNKVDMKQLVRAMERDGFKNVSTYINSGNIFFADTKSSNQQLSKKLHNLIQRDFDLDIPVLLKDAKTIQKIVSAIPVDWVNDSTMKCDVMFLWDTYAHKRVLDELSIRDDIDTVHYCEGALIWSVARENVTRSGMMKLVGTDLYAHMTIRNCNTTRKIYERLAS